MCIFVNAKSRLKREHGLKPSMQKRELIKPKKSTVDLADS
jgi:hypothetical protein